MKFSDYVKDVRLHLFVLIASLSAWLAARYSDALDRLNGDVDAVIGQFHKVDQRLNRAAEAARKRSIRLNTEADRLAEQIEAIEGEIERTDEQADRAARVRARIAKLLD